MKQAADAKLAAETRAVLGNATSMSAGSRQMAVTLAESLAESFVGPVAELGAADPVRAARTVATSAVAAMQYHLFKEEAPGEDELEHLVSFLLAGVASAAR